MKVSLIIWGSENMWLHHSLLSPWYYYDTLQVYSANRGCWSDYLVGGGGDSDQLINLVADRDWHSGDHAHGVGHHPPNLHRPKLVDGTAQDLRAKGPLLQDRPRTDLQTHPQEKIPLVRGQDRLRHTWCCTYLLFNFFPVLHGHT